MTATTAPAVSHDTVPLSKIALHPRNPRRDVGDVSDMAASMLEVGVLEDLLVAPWPAGLDIKKPRGAEYVLVAGHRRLAAAKVAKLKDVPVKVRGDLDTLAKQLEAMLVENLHRSDLTPVEEADTYQELLDLGGLTQTALAKAVGQPVTRIRERLKLARLEQPVKEKVHAGQLTITDAIAIAAFADDKARTKDLLKAVGTPNFRHTLTMAERAREREAEREKKLKPYRGAGVTIAEYDSWNLPKGWKKASEIMAKDYPSEAEQIKWDAKEHATCPGRVVIARTDQLTFACSEGKLHPKPKKEKSAAEVKQANDDRQRRETFAPSSLAATTVRRQHIADVIAHPTDDQAVAGHSHLIVNLLQDEHWWNDREKTKRLELVAPLVSVGLDRNEDLDAQTERVIAALSKLSLESLVVLHWVVKQHGTAEERLADVPKDGRWYGYGSTDQWAAVLTNRLGYQWSDWERETFQVDKALDAEVPADGEEHTVTIVDGAATMDGADQ